MSVGAVEEIWTRGWRRAEMLLLLFVESCWSLNLSDKQGFDLGKVSSNPLSFRSLLLIAAITPVDESSCRWSLVVARLQMQIAAAASGDRRQSRLAGAAASHPQPRPTQIFSTGSSVVQIFCNNSAAAVRPTLLASSDKHTYLQPTKKIKLETPWPHYFTNTGAFSLRL